MIKKLILISKALFITFFLLFLFFVFPSLARGQAIVISPATTHTDVAQILKSVTNFLWVLVAPLSTIMMIWAGILFLTAEGDPQRISTAKKIVTYVVIGIATALIASGISIIITEILS